MLRAGALDNRRGADLERIRRGLQAHVQERVRAPQAPETCRLPFGSDLHPLGVAQQVIAELRGKQQMSRWRTGFDERRSCNILAEKVVVMVIERGDIDVDFLAEQATITNLRAVELLRRKVRIGVESRQIRQGTGSAHEPQ